MTLHLLSNKKVEDNHDIREEEIAAAVEKINKLCSRSEPVDMRELLETFTSDVVCRVTFGRKYREGESGKKFKKMLDEFFEVLGALNLEDCIPQLAWVDRLRGFNAKVERVANDFDEVLDEVVRSG
ncbi:putative indoleacetaldoxime dehydratase [Helianthus anomalus]